MTIVIILAAAVATYAVFAVLRSVTRIDERENEPLYEAKMHDAVETIDGEAERDPTKI